MVDEYGDRLIHGHLDGVLDEAENREFVELMRDSEAARRRFWDLAEVHGLARDAARIAWDDVQPVASRQKGGAILSQRVALLPFRSIGLIAVGLVLGILTAGLSLAFTRPQWESVQLLLAESFETDERPVAGGVPSIVDVWTGDDAEISPALLGVQPAAEQRMLRFLRADYEGKPNPGGYISEVYRLLDVRKYRQTLAGGEAVVQVSALFNAAPFAEDEKYHCSISLHALDVGTVNDSSIRAGTVLNDRALATTRRSNDRLDRDPQTWQKVSTDLRLPPNTDFLLVRIAVAHGTPNRLSQGHDTFAAHFADDVRVVLGRRPALP